jgi:ABC-type nitrate/sulfonate/bicarbonate transport system substrate-binding protein
MLEPNASIAVSQDNIVVFDLAKLYGPYLLTGVTCSDKFINKNQETANKFYTAIDEAIKFCHSAPDSTIKIAQMNFPDVENDVIVNAVNRMVSDKVIPESAEIDSIAFKKLLNTRIIAGDIKSVQNPYKYIYKKKRLFREDSK